MEGDKERGKTRQGDSVFILGSCLKKKVSPALNIFAVLEYLNHPYCFRDLTNNLT